MKELLTIESVVDARLAEAERLRSIDSELGRIADLTLALTSSLRELGADTPDMVRMQVQAADAASEAIKAIGEDRQETARLAERFGSGRLCLAAVGRARQGKSRFLQSLTGLPPDVIPDSNAGFCTGVSSVIRSGEQRRAVVYFLSRQEYFGIVSRYLQELGSPPVADLEEFWLSRPTPPSQSRSISDSLFAHLNSHWEAREAIRGLLGSAPRDVPIVEVRRWVTQSSAGLGGGSAHMAIDRVEITVPYAGGSSLVDVIDLPGLGDTNLTDIDRFSETLERAADVLVMVRMPGHLGDDWNDSDIRLTTEAEKALGSVSLADSLFLLLNRTEEPSNAHNTSRMRESARGRGIHSTEAAIVDASAPSEVRDFFDMVQERIPEIVANSDRTLLADRGAAMRATLGAVTGYVSAASELVGASTPLPEARRQVLYQEAVDGLIQSLDRLASEVANDRGYDEHGLRVEIRRLIESAEDESATWVTTDRFATRAAGPAGLAGAYGYYLSQARARLLAHFGSLDPTLRDHLDQTKMRLAGVMLGQGRLHHLPGLDDDSTLSDILAVLADERLGMPADSYIAASLRTTIAAELAYRGFLQHRVRKALQHLDKDDPLYPLSQFETPVGGLKAVPMEQFVSAIHATVGNALAELQVALDAAGEDADWAAIALVDEFVQRVTGGPDAEAQWRAVYARFQESIWHDEFAAAAAESLATAEASRSLGQLRGALARLESTTGNKERAA